MSDPRNLENNIVKIIAAIAFLVMAYFGIRVLADAYTGKLIQQMSGPAETQKAQFREQIAAQTDAYSACKLGINFSKAQNDDLALLAYQKATDLDPNLRDAWVLRGQSELKNNPPAGGPDKALESLQKAEEIDPINSRTYELLSIAYSQVGDTDNAKKAQEKYEYLTKISSD